MTAGLFGLDMLDLPEGYTPLEGTAVIKCLDDQGRVSLLLRSTQGLNSWECLGMLEAASDSTREGLLGAFVNEVDDEEDE